MLGSTAPGLRAFTSSSPFVRSLNLSSRLDQVLRPDALEFIFSKEEAATRLACIALAIEGRLGRSFLGELGLTDSALRTLLSKEWLSQNGESKPWKLTHGVPYEPAYAWAPRLRQVILRRAHRAGELRAAGEKSELLVGSKSRASLIRRLQEGGLVLRPGHATPDATIEEELTASLLHPFDAQWLTLTWEDRAPVVASRVLRRALFNLDPVDALYRWAMSESDDANASAEHAEANTDAEELAHPDIKESLCAHALHRLDSPGAARLSKDFDATTRLGLEAVAHFQAGNLDLCQRLLDQSLAFAPKKHPPLHSFSPLLAFILSLKNDEESAARALASLKVKGADPSAKSAARGMRVLLQARSQGEAPTGRIALHRLPKDTSAWELLFVALAVYYRGAPEGTRASFSELLAKKGDAWLSHGYPWMARQALVLAAQLDEGQVTKAGISLQGLKPQSSDLAAWVRPKEAWEITLGSLLSVTRELSEPSTQHRVEWYVNPHTASVSKPGLQEFRRGQGWATVRRLDLAELLALKGVLPPEDQKVLSRLEESPGAALDPRAEDFPHGELMEQLIGHCRVVDGTRGGVRLVVVRGICEVVTTEEGDALAVSISPPGLGPGLNVLYDGECLLTVVEVSDAMRRVMEALPSNFRIPRERAHEATRIMGQLAEVVSVRSPTLSDEGKGPADSTPCLRVSPVFGVFLVEAGVRPFGPAGRFFSPGTGPLSLTSTETGRRRCKERNLRDEEARLSALQSLCPTLRRLPDEEKEGRAPGEGAFSWTLSADDLATLLAEVRDSALACEFEWPASSAQKLRGHVSVQSLRGSLRTKKGWYLASGELQLDEVTHIALSELVHLPTLARGRFVRLPSGDFVEIEKRLRRVVAALSLCPKSGSGLRVGPARLAGLSSLRGMPEFSLDGQVEAAIAQFEGSQVTPLEPPSALKATLRPYQVDGFRWIKRLTDLGLGACLADDMGLGKTIQILAFLLTRPKGARHLVVAPTSVCTNWLREIQRFAPSLEAQEYVGPKRSALLEPFGTETQVPPSRVVIVSYALLHEDGERLSAERFDTVVLDEAQFIKNPHSLRARAAFSLHADRRIISTGTPVENHLGDLWSLFHFLNPDLLGSWKGFDTHFVKPIHRDADATRAEVLREMVRPYMLRRTKQQVLKELPPLTTVRHTISLNSDETLRYSQLRKEIFNKLYTSAGKRHSKLEVLAELTRLRRFCCHQQLVFPGAPRQSGKLEALVDLVDELRQNGHRALVFSQYVDFLDLARERLDEQGISYLYLDGSTPKKKRQSLVDEFQEGEAALFLMSLKAGGLGLNLTGADYVIHLDPWWNPAVASQATDRAHRMGQSRPVTVYEFVTRDTIEEDILTLHSSKKAVANSLLEGGDKVAGLTDEDFKRWLSRSAEPLQG